MADLNSLKEDLRNLSSEDLQELLTGMRTSRRTTKTNTVVRAQKAAKSGIITKASLTNVMSGISPEKAAELLAQLQGEKK